MSSTNWTVTKPRVQHKMDRYSPQYPPQVDCHSLTSNVHHKVYPCSPKCPSQSGPSLTHQQCPPRSGPSLTHQQCPPHRHSPISSVHHTVTHPSAVSTTPSLTHQQCPPHRHSPISSVRHKVDRHSPISSVHHKVDRHSPISSVHHNGTRSVQAGVDDGLGDECGHGHHDDLVVACIRVEDQP